MAKRKDKLAEILQTYSEEEIREICAASSSRTDFAKRLGISAPIDDRLLCDIVDHYHLTLLTKNRLSISEKSLNKLLLYAAANSVTYHDVAAILGKRYQTLEIERLSIKRFLNNRNIDHSFLKDILLEIFDNHNAAKLASLIEHCESNSIFFAKACGCEYCSQEYADDLFEYVSNILAMKNGYDALKNGDFEYINKSALKTVNVFSFVYHRGSQTKCSGCGNLIYDTGFLSSNDIEIPQFALSTSILCEKCHAENKKEYLVDFNFTSLERLTNVNDHKHGIYLIRQKSNGKLYVGETKRSFRTRMKDHFDNAFSNNASLRYQKIDKALFIYGLSDFEFYILQPIESNDKTYLLKTERKWILKLGTMNPLVGYNAYISQGNMNELNEEDIDEIIGQIKYSNRTLSDIAFKYNMSISTISRIKNGKTHRRKGEIYPVLMPLEKEQYNKIVKCLELLTDPNLSISEIAREIDLSETTVRTYNKGVFPASLKAYLKSNQIFQQNIWPIKTCPDKSKQTIPIKHTSVLDKYGAEYIFKELLNRPLVALAKEFNTSDTNIKKYLHVRGYPATISEIADWLDQHPKVESNKRIPSRSDLIEKLNNMGVLRCAKYYHVDPSTVRKWIKKREITLCQISQINCVELDITISGITEMARYLVEHKYISQNNQSYRQIAGRIIYAIDHSNGFYQGYSFVRVPTPFAQ